MIKYHILGALCVSTWTDVWFHRLSVFLRNSGALSIREAFPEANLLFFNISPPGGFWRLKTCANESGREEGFCKFIPASINPDHSSHTSFYSVPSNCKRCATPQNKRRADGYKSNRMKELFVDNFDQCYGSAQKKSLMSDTGKPS